MNIHEENLSDFILGQHLFIEAIVVSVRGDDPPLVLVSVDN